jgi:hypothetical protein
MRRTKNPFMSLWLSGANRAAAKGKGLWMAAARRQQTAAANEATKAVNSLKTPTARKRKKTTR